MTNGEKPPSSDDVLEAIRRLVSGSGDSDKIETENAEAMKNSSKKDPVKDEEDTAELELVQGEEDGARSRFVLAPSFRVLEDNPSDGSANQPEEPRTDVKPDANEAPKSKEHPANARIAEAQQSLAAKIAALEAVIESQKRDWEPDGISEEETLDEAPLATEVVEVDETDEANLLDVRAPKDLATQEPKTVEMDETEDAVPARAEPVSQIDFEDLQSQITRIVRDELTGVLGEDITRSVRALVRREIDRALTIRDLS